MAILTELWQSSQGQKLALLCAIWPVLFIPINFALYYGYDSDNYNRQDGVHQIPTISLAGSRHPSSALLTYGLHMEAFALVLFFVAIYKEMEQKIEQFQSSTIPFETLDFDADLTLFGRIVEALTLNGCSWCCCKSKNAFSVRSLNTANKFALAVGLLGAFCMSMVGSIQVVANEAVHGTFAVFMFLFGTVHVLVFYYGLSKVLTSSLLAQWLRQVCIFVTIPFNLLVLVIAVIVYSTCDSFPCRAFAVDIIPVLEFTTVTALFLYIASFYWELTNTVLVTVTVTSSLPPPLQRGVQPESVV